MRNAVLLHAAILMNFGLLSACSMPHDYEAIEVKSVQDYQYEQVFNDIEAINWPSDRWWTRYQDAQLDQLITEAIENSPNITIASARLKAATGIARQIGAIQTVQADANVSASLSKISYGYQAYEPPRNWNDFGSMTLNFSYEFDFWDKNKSAFNAASMQLAAAEAEQAAAKLIIATSVANSYAELSRLYAELKTVASAVVLRRKTVELLTNRFKEGLETQGAVRQAESAASSAEAEFLAIEESIELQKNGLAALLGQGPGRGALISAPVIKLSGKFGLPEDAGIGLLGRRPDLSAARWRAESMAENIKVARAEFYPNVNISAYIGLQAFGLDNLLASGNDAGGIGPALYLPIFTGGRLEGQLSSAEARYEEAVASYNATLTHALHEMADVVTSSKALNARIEKTRETVAAARSAQQIATNRYEGGLATYLEVLTAQSALLIYERSLANLECRAFTLNVALVRALGGGYQEN